MLKAVTMGTTGLLPIIFLPIMGISSGSTVSSLYLSDSVMICLGSLLIASAVEKYNLHNKFALVILKFSKTNNPEALILSFVLVTGFLSMWLSNTATAALMVPLSKALITSVQDSRNDIIITMNDKEHNEISNPSKKQKPETETETETETENKTETAKKMEKSPHQVENLCKPAEKSALDPETKLLAAAIDLGIAYSASIGGMATLTGTGANIALQGTLLSQFGPEGSITFLEWLMLAAPLSILNLLILWVVLVLSFTKNKLFSAFLVYRFSFLFSSFRSFSLLFCRCAFQCKSGRNRYIKQIDSNDVWEREEDQDNSTTDEKPKLSSPTNSQEGEIDIFMYNNKNNPPSYVVSDVRSPLDDFNNDEKTDEFEVINFSNFSDEKPPSSILEKDKGLRVVEESKPLTYPETMVLLTFITMAALWITRNPPGVSKFITSVLI
jgi:hypothetical protein